MASIQADHDEQQARRTIDGGHLFCFSTAVYGLRLRSRPLREGMRRRAGVFETVRGRIWSRKLLLRLLSFGVCHYLRCDAVAFFDEFDCSNIQRGRAHMQNE